MHNFLPSLSSSGDFLHWEVVGDCSDCFSSFSRPSAVVWRRTGVSDPLLLLLVVDAPSLQWFKCLLQWLFVVPSAAAAIAAMEDDVNTSRPLRTGVSGIEVSDPLLLLLIEVAPSSLRLFVVLSVALAAVNVVAVTAVADNDEDTVEGLRLVSAFFGLELSHLCRPWGFEDILVRLKSSLEEIDLLDCCFFDDDLLAFAVVDDMMR